MTNPTRTRAAIQAEIEKLQAALLEHTPEREWSGGDKVWVKGVLPFKPCTNEKYGVCLDLMGVDRSTIDSGGLWISESALIPAADLVPREDHERAVKEAVDKALNGDLSAEEKAYALGAMNTRVLNEHDALDVLVKEYAYKPLDNSPTELEWAHEGQLYRVTVERVDAEPEPASDDQASANRLVEWYAANKREHKMTWSHDVNGRTYFVCVAPHDGTGYAPDPQAVAPVGLLEELRKLKAQCDRNDYENALDMAATILAQLQHVWPALAAFEGRES